MKKAIFDKKNILVIGGAGFIGSHLCDELVKSAKIICLDNFSTGDERNVDHLLSDPNFVFVKHDISEPIVLEDIAGLQKFKVEFQGVQEIYNLACPTSPLHFKENRIANLMANSYGMKNSLDLAVKYEAKYLFFSSSVVYGPKRADGQRIQEGDTGAVNFIGERCSYDEGKRFAEAMAVTYRDVHSIDVKIARLFRAYGPRMKLGDGQMLPDFINDALDNKDITINGDENFMSSFCYIQDVVEAAVKLINSKVAGPINIGSDVAVNITDVAQMIIDIIGSTSKIAYTREEMLFMSQLNIPDTTMARNELVWMPVVTLSNGLAKTIEDLRVGKGLKKAWSR